MGGSADAVHAKGVGFSLISLDKPVDLSNELFDVVERPPTDHFASDNPEPGFHLVESRIVRWGKAYLKRNLTKVA